MAFAPNRFQQRRRSRGCLHSRRTERVLIVALDILGLRALSFIHRLGRVNFERTISLGRQSLSLDPDSLRAARRLALPQLDSIAREEFAEPLFAALGSKRFESLDASDYEGASIIHDFNQDIPEHLRAQFTAYLDLGSMEHVFSVASTVLNVNRLLAVDGQAIILTMCNGFSGHGFYQLSPEFFFSAFSPTNGFDSTMVILIDAHRPRRWYFVRNPAAAGERVHLPNRTYYILCIARKTRSVNVVTAQQSDYLALWQRPGSEGRRTARRFARVRAALRRVRPAIMKLIPNAVKEQRTVLRVRGPFRRNVKRFDPDTASAQEVQALLAWSNEPRR